MSVATYSQFGRDDVCLYREYLGACVAGFSATCGDDAARRPLELGVELLQRMVGSGLSSRGSLECGGVDVADGGSPGLCVGQCACGGCCGDSAARIGDSSVDAECTGRVGAGKSGGDPACGISGAGFCCVSGDGVLASGEGLAASGDAGDSLSGVARQGRQWWKNQKKSKKRKMASKDWRKGARPLVDGSGGCVSSGSDAGSVATVDTRTAVEIEASQTLAARRVAENKYEIARLQAKTRSFDDKSKTEALGRLEAARMEQRINQAIARSQKAYGETDKSLKSLGSTGSAGEFALKKEVKRGEEHRIRSEYLQAQIDKVMRYAPPSVREEIANMKPPVFPTDEEIFGDCPESWSESEKMDYYDEQERHDEQLAFESMDHRIIREPENVVFDPTLREDMRRLRDLTVFE